MNEDEIIEFLTWLEALFPVRTEFPDKHTLASEFIEQRSYRIYDEWKREHES